MRMRSIALWIGASGLRSSWPRIARNSSLRRFASVAASNSRVGQHGYPEGALAAYRTVLLDAHLRAEEFEQQAEAVGGIAVVVDDEHAPQGRGGSVVRGNLLGALGLG